MTDPLDPLIHVPARLLRLPDRLAGEGDDNDEQIPLRSARITNHDHGQIQ
jgi:hypothetical protein